MSEKQISEATSRAPISQRASALGTFRKRISGDELIEVTIDGVEVEAPIGTTILEVCRGQGIHIPTLCQHDDLCIAGVCRICVVEVEGYRTLQAPVRFRLPNRSASRHMHPRFVVLDVTSST